jgi:hypothetical protein
MNKPTVAFLLIALTAPTITTVALGGSEPPDAVKVFLLDDQTGEELQRVHGIQPLKVDDLLVLVNAVLQGNIPVQLVHQAIDEDASDNPLAQMAFKPFAGGAPPTAPLPNMPLRQFAEASKVYNQKRAVWHRGILDYRKEIGVAAEAFVQRVAAIQLEVAQRFDRILAERNGRDFNRSDIFGSIGIANRVLGKTGRRVLVINSDAEDLPGKRKPRITPLTETELDSGIELIFVNTSRLPEQSRLFAGVKNNVSHADSMVEAMEIVVKMLSPADEKKSVASLSDGKSR